MQFYSTVQGKRDAKERKKERKKEEDMGGVQELFISFNLQRINILSIIYLWHPVVCQLYK